MNTAEYFKQNLLTHGLEWLERWEDDTRENAPEILVVLRLAGLDEQVNKYASVAVSYATRAAIYASDATLPPGEVAFQDRFDGQSVSDSATKMRRAIAMDCAYMLDGVWGNVKSLLMRTGMDAAEADKTAWVVLAQYIDSLLEKYGASQYSYTLREQLEALKKEYEA